MAQIVQCDLHTEPVAADFITTNIATGDTLGTCIEHMIAFGDSLRDTVEAMQETGAPPDDHEGDPVLNGTADANADAAIAAGVLTSG